MPVYIALFRAVNVGGSNTLSMADLKSICVDAGFAQVETYIASGNVLFTSRLSEPKVKTAMEERLQTHAGRPVGVVVRTAQEPADVLKANPFPDAPANHTVAIFLNASPSLDTLDHVRGVNDEEVRLGRREIYVRYGTLGIGRSKLKIPAARDGTARNMSTVAKLVQLAAARR
jgi:uncharacterized protein (DUF1697 family)